MFDIPVRITIRRDLDDDPQYHFFCRRQMSSQKDKGSQPRRKTSSQPSLISNYFKKVESPSQKGQSTQSILSATSNGKLPGYPSKTISPNASDEDNEEERVRKRPRLQTPPSSEPPRAIT